MGSQSYLCWAFCLVQIFSVNARPEFGTAFQFPTSPTITMLAGQMSNQLAALDDRLHFMLSNTIPNSGAPLDVLRNFAENLSVAGKDFTTAVEDLVTSTTSVGLVSPFDHALDAYDLLIEFLNNNQNAFRQAMSSQLSQYLGSEMFDALVFGFETISSLRTSLASLKTAVEEASSASDVSDTLFQALVRALRDANAHLPVLVYVFQHVGVNYQTADAAYVGFDLDVQANQQFYIDDAEQFANEASALQAALSRTFSHTRDEYGDVREELQERLTGDITTIPNFAQINTALLAFIDNAVTFLQDFEEIDIAQAATEYFGELQELVTDDYYKNAALYTPAEQLTFSLIESNVFAEYCFHMFQTLVGDLPVVGRVRLNECLDTERLRFGKLQHLLSTYAKMLEYDVEDLLSNIQPCMDRHVNGCLERMTTFYTTLRETRSPRAEGIGRFTVTEVGASLTRMKFCMARAEQYTFGRVVPQLVASMEQCYGGIGPEPV